MRKPEMYKCLCGFTTYNYQQFLEHFARHMQFEMMYDRLRKELEGGGGRT